MAKFLGREVMLRAMSAFNHAPPGWEAIALRAVQDLIAPILPLHATSKTSGVGGKQQLTMTSWNLQSYLFHTRAVDRNKFILDKILDGHNPSDVICFQEVNCRVREIILEDERIRSRYLTTDAEDTFRFTNVPMNFANMMLLSKNRFGSMLHTGDEGKLIIDKVFRMKLDTNEVEKREKKMEKEQEDKKDIKEDLEPQMRDALCVDFASPSSPGKICRLMNVHLQSGGIRGWKRPYQLELVKHLLHEPNVSNGIIAGDFNALSPDEHSMIEKFKLLDAWIALHGSKNGDTWRVGETDAGRPDKIVMFGAKPDKIEILTPGLTKYGFKWSEHCGLRSTFTI